LSPNRDVRPIDPSSSREGVRRSRIRGSLPALALALALVAVGVTLGACGNRGTPDAGPAGRFEAGTAGGGPFVHLVLRGTPRWMGLEQGRLLRESIRASVARGISHPEGIGAKTFAGPVRALLPKAVEEELQGIASGAGVPADDLFLLEVAREGRRWQSDAPGLLEASFAAAPGAGAPLVVAFEGLLGRAALPDPLVVIERHPTGGVATLCLSSAGGLGALLGTSSKGLVAAMGEVEVEPERRSIKGLPMAIALRLGLEAATTPRELIASLPGLSGHRVVVGGPDGSRVSALLSLVAEEPETFAPEHWLLLAAGPRAPTNPRTLALARHRQGRRTPPLPEDAYGFALAGRSPANDDPVALLAPDGLSVRFPSRQRAEEPTYRWAEGAAALTK